MKNIFKICMIAFSLFLVSHVVHAQTAALLPNASQTFLNNNGDPLSSGTVNFYIPNTTTPKTVWQDATQTTPWSNTITLNAAGRPPGDKGIYGNGTYRQIVKDRNNNIIWDQPTAAVGSSGSGTAVGDGNSVGTILAWSGMLAPNQYQFAYGQTLSRTTFPELLAATTLLTNITCVGGNTTVSGISDTSNIPVGAALEATCIPSGSVVTSKTLTSVVMSIAANVSTATSGRFFPYGNGNGTTTFNAPDLRGVTLTGRDNMGGVVANRTPNGANVGQLLALANFNYVTQQATYNSISLLSGSSATYTPSTNVNLIKVRMIAGGGGGYGVNGTPTDGNNSVFGGWTTVSGKGGTGGTTGPGGLGGTGGVNGSGTLITRISGSRGGPGFGIAGSAINAVGQYGGVSPFGGAGVSTGSASAGGSAAPNSGSGGAGAGNTNVAGHPGGGAGEYVEFWVLNPTATSYTVGIGGNGGSGSPVGGAGGSGQILIDEYFLPPTVVSNLVSTTSGTNQYTRTINYVVKVTPDTSVSGLFGVASLGGMQGIIACGTGITCAGNTITAAAAGAGGSDTQVQYNSATALAGSPAFIWVSPKLTIGLNGTVTGQLGLAGATSGNLTQTVGSIAGTPIITWGNGTGTPAVTASAPLVINTTTGNLTITGAALTKTDDTNVTLTLGGSPSNALVNASSLTLGWTGQLGISRGGTNCAAASGTCLDNITGFSATGFLTRTGAGTYAFQSTTNGIVNSNLAQAGAATLKGNPTASTANVSDFTIQGLTARGAPDAANDKLPIFDNAAGTIKYVTPAQLTPSAALTKADDTNVTLTLGGAPSTALLNAASLTLGWTGTLSAGRLNSNVVQSVVNDTNVTGSVSAQALTLGWTGNLAVGRGGTGAGTFTANLPLIGNGTGAIAQGTRSGNTTTFATTTGTLTNGNCVKFDASGNLVDNGSVCGQSPGGTSGQTQYNNSGAFAGYTMSGDCTIVTSTGVITCTKSNNVAFGTAAFANTGTSAHTIPYLDVANIWSALQSFSSVDAAVLTLSGITGSVQCLNVNSSGVVSGTGSACGSGGGGGTPGGSNGQVQYNSGGLFAGSANFAFSGSTVSIGSVAGGTGVLSLLGNTSGNVNLTAQAVAGTPTVTFGTSSGTPAVTASSPLAITTATGNITCATCGVTSSGLDQFASTTSAQLAGVISNETGTGVLVFNTSPTLVTPTLGAASATSINGLTITSSTGTLTVANGKTLTASNSLAMAGTDGTTMTFPSASATITQTIASGATALATSAIASATCTSAQTATATGAATTDAVAANFSADPTAVTGYVPLTTGMLTIIPWLTLNTINFKVCNNTAASITPGAVTINWRITR